jgi:hypothetical protein
MVVGGWRGGSNCAIGVLLYVKGRLQGINHGSYEEDDGKTWQHSTHEESPESKMM